MQQSNIHKDHSFETITPLNHEQLVNKETAKARETTGYALSKHKGHLIRSLYLNEGHADACINPRLPLKRCLELHSKKNLLDLGFRTASPSKPYSLIALITLPSMGLFKKILRSRSSSKGAADPEPATPAIESSPQQQDTSSESSTDTDEQSQQRPKYPDHCIPESHILTCGHRLGTRAKPLEPTICTLSCKTPTIKPRSMYPDVSMGGSAHSPTGSDEFNAETRLRDFGPEYLICNICYFTEETRRFYFFMQDAGPGTAVWIRRVEEANPIKVHGHPTVVTVSCRTAAGRTIGGSFPAALVESYEQGGAEILSEYASYYINRPTHGALPPHIVTEPKRTFNVQYRYGRGPFQHLLKELKVPKRHKAKRAVFKDEPEVFVIDDLQSEPQGIRPTGRVPDALLPGRRGSDASSLSSLSSQDSITSVDNPEDVPSNRLGRIARTRDVDFGGKATGNKTERRESFDSDISQITQASDSSSTHSFSTQQQPLSRRGSYASSTSTISTVSSAGSAAELFLETTLSRDTNQSRGRRSREGSGSRGRARSNSSGRSLGLLPNDQIRSTLDDLQSRIDALDNYERRSQASGSVAGRSSRSSNRARLNQLR